MASKPSATLGSGCFTLSAGENLYATVDFSEAENLTPDELFYMMSKALREAVDFGKDYRSNELQATAEANAAYQKAVTASSDSKKPKPSPRRNGVEFG